MHHSDGTLRKHAAPRKFTAFQFTVFPLLLALLLLTAFSGRAARLTEDQEIIDAVYENFLLVSSVPRPSCHEEKISNLLRDWAEAQGLRAVQDGLFNLMIDVPATEGCEDLPLGILQVHLDMVVAVADGKTFDPLADPITPIRDDAAGTVTADGTSLGGDDGIGIALVMAAVQGKMDHGPIRAIFTADEESTLTGARNLDPAWLDGAAFLINVDNEESDNVVVSTASGDDILVSKAPAFTEAAGDLALSVRLSGLKGGHSGQEINRGRLNGIIGLGAFLKELKEEGVGFELASFRGGQYPNAIPTGAEAVLVIRAEDRETVTGLAAACAARLAETYAGIEDNPEMTVTEVSPVPRVVSEEERDQAIRYITEIIDGVYTWSEDVPGMAESSSNLGVFNLGEEGFAAASCVRSSAPEKREEICGAQTRLAEACGYTVEQISTADAWPYNPDSALLKKALEIYREQNGEELKVLLLHAGLECGTFMHMKPELDMISIGPDLTDVHSIHETLYLNSIPRTWRLMEGLLTEWLNAD